ncbi:MAG: GntR family transcriptional regulator [Ruminococcaceae bacterium]|nr:GntR family transcriptional regulator [Oscillospiraceae bacterium]
MEQIYQINPELDIPIYRQLVDAIRAAVKKGILVSGQQLPTVQEVSADLSIAVGTIKRAYDELQREGLVEKIQGRGTFVSYRPADKKSRKDQAMEAIDAMLDRLEEMGFSAGEISIYLNLKLRERAEGEQSVKVALLECNPENLSQMTEQLRSLGNVELYSHLMESVEEYPYKIGEDMEMVVTTATHAQEVESLLPIPKRVIRVGLRLTPSCLAEIVKLRKNQTAGILCYSPRFGHLLQSTCRTYAEDVKVAEPEVFAPDMDIAAYLKGKDAVLVPKEYEKYCTVHVAQALRSFRGKCIECAYEMDEGSVLYLQEKIKRILESKTL